MLMLKPFEFISSFMAPEVIVSNKHSPYTQKADIWSLGVVLYTMLSGEYPFTSSSEVLGSELTFDESLSVAAVEILKKMIEKNVSNRYNIHNVLIDNWMTADAIDMANNLMA